MDYTGHRVLSKIRPEITDNWKKEEKQKPMLRSDWIGGTEENGVVLGSVFPRKKVCEINFVEMDFKNIPVGAWDVSANGKRTIWAWMNKTSDGYILNIGSENGVYANLNCQNLFKKYSNIKRINFNNLFDTSRVIDMSNMFFGCQSLEELDIKSFDTKNVTNMQGMFAWCTMLQRLDLSGFNTQNVKDMGCMFWDCKNLQRLDVRGFDTKNVTNMKEMFLNCENLQTLDVRGFDTKNVTNMESMFWNCKNLQKLNVSSFDTENVTDMGFMFWNCKNLQTLDISGFKTSKVKNMKRMFYGCKKITKLDISNFYFSPNCITTEMFENSGVDNIQTEKGSTTEVGDKTEIKNISTSQSIFKRLVSVILKNNF